MEEQQTRQIDYYANYFFPFIWKTDEFLTLEQWIGKEKRQRQTDTSGDALYWEEDHTLECEPPQHELTVTGRSKLQCLYEQEMSMEVEDANYLTAVQTMEFFSSAAKNIIHPAINEKESVRKLSCQNYRLCMPSPMTIQLVFSNGQNTQELSVQGIYLKLLEAGFGVLTFRTYLTTNQKDSYENALKIINRCNEAFRHVSMPFYVKDHPLMPESVVLRCGETEIRQVWNLNSFRMDYITCIITDLLTKPFSRNGAVNQQRKKIKRCLDDRMFVHGCYRNNGMSEILEKNDALEGEELSKLIYQYLYIENELSSPTESFRKQELENTLYHRWREYGTISGVTPHSFMMITGESDDIDNSVVLPMVHIYAYMLEIILLQKAALMYFEAQCSFVCQDVKKIVPLHEQYTKVRTYLLIHELSTQLQPREIFNILRDKLEIHSMQENLAATMEGLFAKVEYNETGILNSVLLFLTSLTLIPNFIKIEETAWFESPPCLRLGLLFVSLLVTCFFYRWLYRCVTKLGRNLRALLHRR